MTKLKSNRVYWGKNYNELPELDLTFIQRESWGWFLKEGLREAFEKINPIEDFTGKNWMLEFFDHRIEEPSIAPSRARRKGLTYSAPVYIQAKLTNKITGSKDVQEVFLGDFPLTTENGTFIINGIDRAVVNQIVRSPGIYFGSNVDASSGKLLYSAEIRPVRGTWLEFEITRYDTLIARIDRRRKFPATTLLRAVGYSTNDKIRELFKDFKDEKVVDLLENTLKKDNSKNREEALIEIYKKMHPGEPAVLDNAENQLARMFFNSRTYDLTDIGRYKVTKKLKLNERKDESTTLNPEDIVNTLRYLVGLPSGKGKVDDIDHLANRRIRRVGELVANTSLRVGLLRLERAVKEKMSLNDPNDEEPITPIRLVNARPVIAAVNEFFRSNQLSAILDQVNPLAEIDNLRRLSVMGIGGITRERASFSIRDISSSQYSRICPIRSPEGQNIGLVTYLSLYTRVNKFGFLEAPYRKVIKEKVGRNIKMKVTNEIDYLTSDDEEDYKITFADIDVDENGYIKDSWLPLRYNGQFTEGNASELDYIDIVPRQVVGTAASLIPFLANDDSIRALMGTHMQCQAVPLVKPSSPLVGTGMESTVAEALNWVMKARHSGIVSYVDANKVVVELDKPPTDGTGKDDGLAANELITINGKQETYSIVKFKRSSQSTCYNQKPLVKIGDRIKAGDLIIDGPACDCGELSLGQNLLIAYMQFDGLGYEDSIVISDRLVREDLLTSIHIEEHDTDLVDTKLGPEELTRDIPNVSEQELAKLAEDGIITIGSLVGPGDILVGKIAPKGETELTAEERLLRAIFGEKAREVRDTSLRMPHGEQGIVVDVQILDRNKGDELQPGTLKKIIVRVAQIRKITVGDKLAGRHGNKGVISKVVPQADMPYMSDGRPVDIIISPLSVLARMNLGQLMEAQLGMGMFKTGDKVALPVFDTMFQNKMEDFLKSTGLSASGKITLYDGRTGEQYETPTMVGIGYILKLIHMVEDKTHARSTGPYSLVTQQPLGGKAQMGGQRLGEMEVWALEGHRAAYTLQEMLTTKSDDVVGRSKAFEAIVKGIDIPDSNVPESFRVLVKELQSLGIEVNPYGVVESLDDKESVEEFMKSRNDDSGVAGVQNDDSSSHDDDEEEEDGEEEQDENIDEINMPTEESTIENSDKKENEDKEK